MGRISTIKPTIYSLSIVSLLTSAVLLSGCNIGKKSNEHQAYKDARLNNPLEIPPDLTAVPENSAISIPGTDSQLSISDSETYESFEKYQQWEDFEKFREWKRSQGEELTFEEFQLAKAQDPLLRKTEMPVSTETNDAGIRQIRVRDDYKNVWRRVNDALVLIDANPGKSDFDDGWIQVKYKTIDPVETGVFSRVWGGIKGGQKYRIQLQPEEASTLISIQTRKGLPANPTETKQLFNSIYTQLKS